MATETHGAGNSGQEIVYKSAFEFAEEWTDIGAIDINSVDFATGLEDELVIAMLVHMLGKREGVTSFIQQYWANYQKVCEKKREKEQRLKEEAEKKAVEEAAKQAQVELDAENARELQELLDFEAKLQAQ